MSDRSLCEGVCRHWYWLNGSRVSSSKSSISTPLRQELGFAVRTCPKRRRAGPGVRGVEERGTIGGAVLLAWASISRGGLQCVEKWAVPPAVPPLSVEGNCGCLKSVVTKHSHRGISPFTLDGNRVTTEWRSLKGLKYWRHLNTTTPYL